LTLPTNVTQGIAWGTSDSYMVGSGHLTGTGTVPICWDVATNTPTFLARNNADMGEALDTDGGKSVGYLFTQGNVSSPADARATLWENGNFMSLHPAMGFLRSFAAGVSGNYQVGSGVTPGSFGTDGPQHALAWSGTAASVMDMHPMGWSQSGAVDVSSYGTVGFGMQQSNSNPHALLWRGTPAAGIAIRDLHGAIPNSANYSHSWAYGINANGDIVGEARIANSNNSDGVLWQRLVLRRLQVIPERLRFPREVFAIIRMNMAAPVDGASVLLKTSIPDSPVSFPKYVAIQKGKSEVSFPIKVERPVYKTTVIPIYATYDGDTVTGYLTIDP
jgi:uncharacterized membrane protein